MKRKLFAITLLMVIFLITGCRGRSEKDIVGDLSDKIKNADTYKLEGTLELLNNDDMYNYDVEVSFKKDNMYKVRLVNQANNHEQIILKNNDGVYVLTPSLNKSFKFQSDWPYSNSQIYLLQSVINDLTQDDNRIFKELEDGYQFTTTVDYPNNPLLIKQDILLDKDLNIKEIIVLNEEEIPQMTMRFTNIDFSPSFKEDYFELEIIMENINVEEKEIPVGLIDQSIFPLAIPSGTRLISKEEVERPDGERVIMTFGGERPFLLVQETANVRDEFTVIPTRGEPHLLIDTLGVLTNNSITWSSNGIEYFIVSDVLSRQELIDVASSINVIQVMK